MFNSYLFSLIARKCTYCNCGKMAGSAEWGVIGVMGPGVAGPILAGATGATEPPRLTIGDDIIVCC